MHKRNSPSLLNLSIPASVYPEALKLKARCAVFLINMIGLTEKRNPPKNLPFKYRLKATATPWTMEYRPYNNKLRAKMEVDKTRCHLSFPFYGASPQELPNVELTLLTHEIDQCANIVSSTIYITIAIVEVVSYLSPDVRDDVLKLLSNDFCDIGRVVRLSPMLLYLLQSPLRILSQSRSASPFSQVKMNTFMPNPICITFIHSRMRHFLPEPIQPMPTFTQTAFPLHNLLFTDKLLIPATKTNPMSVKSLIKSSHTGQGYSPKRLGQDAKGKTIVSSSHFLDETCFADKGYLDGSQGRFFGNEESKEDYRNMLKQHLQNSRDRRRRAYISDMTNDVQNDTESFFALKTRGGLESTNFDDLNNKLRSLELDVKIGHSYGVKATAAPTHSAFIGTACSGSKPTYSDQQRIVPSVSQTPGRSDNVEKKAGRKNELQQSSASQNLTEEKCRCYKCLQLEILQGSVMVKTVDIRLIITQQNNTTGAVEKVYGMMAGLHADSADASNAAAEFAELGFLLIEKTDSINSAGRISPASVPADQQLFSAGRTQVLLCSIPAARTIFQTSPVYLNTPTNLKMTLLFMDKGRWILLLRPSKLPWRIKDHSFWGSKSMLGISSTYMVFTINDPQGGSSLKLAGSLSVLMAFVCMIVGDPRTDKT
ncbi:hypothetical protein Tco_0626489 [Tanacetum coccineum]|uniref:Uncharacterized protein n=1 Tax=Tanacetum coccineum TaxID=301880 RepID=A0ABQ4WJT3_9ASTR